MKLKCVLGAVVCAALAVAACGDDDENPPAGSSGKGGSGGGSGSAGSAGTGTGGSTGGSAGTGETGGTAGGDAGPDSSAGTGDGGPIEFSGLVPLSATEHDRVFAAAFDAEGRIYLAGFVNQPRGTDTDTKFAVGRFLPNGARDTTFGDQGVASHDVIRGTVAGVSAGLETARGVVVQSTGKIVLVGHAEKNAGDADAATQDADIIALRFTSGGQLDAGFGDDGVKRIDLGPGGASVRDQAWGMALAAQDELILFASTRAADPRTDRDRVVVALTADGQPDNAFNAGAGKYVLDADGLNLSDSPRNGLVQPDGKIVWAGYTGFGTPANNQIVLLRLNPDGTPDNGFGGDGHAVVAPLAAPGMTESYGVTRQSSGKYITTGYGRAEAAPATVDMVSARVNGDGTEDMSWSNGDGLFLYDAAGFDDRSRNLIALPDDRIVMVGTAKPTAGNEDALVVLLTAAGVRDNSFDQDGVRTFDFGRTADEEFFGVALSPDHKWVAAAGYSQAAATDGGAPEDDDASLAIFRVAP